MTLSPLMIFTLVFGTPLLAGAIACIYFDDSEDDDDRYSPISLHPAIVLALAAIIPSIIAYILWLLTHSPAITVGLSVGISFLAAHLYGEFFAKRDDETESKKKKSKDQHQPAPTLRSHPPSVTTSHPRRAHRPRVASAAKGR